MKRSWLGAALLALLLVISLVAGWGMDRCQEPVSQGLEAAGGLVLTGDWRRARDSVKDSMERWERCRPIIAALGNQGAMEEVDSLLARLEVLLHTCDTQAAALCAEIARRIADMRPTGDWWDLM